MASRPGSGAGDQQQVTSQPGGAEDAGGQPSVPHEEDMEGGSNLPEDIWLKDIDDMYPNLQGQTYSLPPYHFNRVPFTVNVIAGLTARVTAACSQSPQDSQQPALTSQAQRSQQVAGNLYTQNPKNLQPKHYTEDDAVDDQAQAKCLHALHDISGEPMMVISQLHIKNYLDNKSNTDPHRHRDVISQLPTPAGLPSNLADRECDILIIHPDHGLLVAEVKSVGSKPNYSNDSIIVKKVKQAIGQLNNLEVAFKHLLKDLPGISISKAVLLPYLTSSQLRSALSSSESLKRDLIDCTKSVDVDQAISRCLFSDDLKQPGLSAWWQNVWSVSSLLPSPQLYKRLVARFCGVASTVYIPTASPPRVVVRSLGQAVAETGLRFSALILTRDQVALLDKHPPHLYLQGPPGTGKTLVLFLGALKSALQGKKVVIAHMPGDVAVATLLKLQLTSIVGATTAAQLIHLHPIDFVDRDLDVKADVATLRQQVGQEDNVHIIVDEVPQFGGHQFLPWVTAVGNTWPQALLWMAGLRIRDNTARGLSYCLPQWVETATLRVSLRCPPTVADHVAERDDHLINDSYIPRYVTPPGPQHTAGPDVRELRHTPGVGGHTKGLDDLLGCERCADIVASVITELGVGQTGHGLQYRDVFVLTGRRCPAPPRDDDVFVQRLRHHHRLPVRVVTTPPSGDDALQLATAVEDEIIITDWTAVQGLERRAVFVLGAGGDWTEDYVPFTRTTALLCYITGPRDD